MIFTSFRICKTFRAFKITFLKLKENQQLVNTPDFTLNYFHKLQRHLSDEAKLYLQLSEIFTI